MLAHRLRRWPNIETTLGQDVHVFAGKGPFVVIYALLDTTS